MPTFGADRVRASEVLPGGFDLWNAARPAGTKENTVMRTALVSLVVSGLVATGSPVAGQVAVGALAVDERQGDQYGWAVDYETAAAARAAALGECGAGCSVVLTFDRCGAYAADQDADSTAAGWAEAYDSAASARAAALSECRARGGGSGCIVRAWGCNGPVVEEGLGLDRAARREIQLGLRAGGFDPGGADGLFGPRTRAAIRGWQTSRGARATGYLDSPSAEALRPAGRSGPAVAAATTPTAVPVQAPAATAEQETVFWQSIANSTNPAEFEAYLAQFPNGVFSALARARLSPLESSGPAAGAAGTRVGGAATAAPGVRVPGRRPGATAAAPVAADAPLRPGEVFRDCAECPEMVVLTGGRMALGRYEVTVGEYRAFASATGSGAGGGCFFPDDGDSWRNPGFRQTDRHPVTCVNWGDAREYVSWLSRTTGERYRLPTEEEWGRAAAGTPEKGCGSDAGQWERGTCPVGSYGANAAGLSDMVGNVWEWTADCWEGDCGRRVGRGGSWSDAAGFLLPGARFWFGVGSRVGSVGFRVSRDAGLGLDTFVSLCLGGSGGLRPPATAVVVCSDAGRARSDRRRVDPTGAGAPLLSGRRPVHSVRAPPRAADRET